MHNYCTQDTKRESRHSESWTVCIDTYIHTPDGGFANTSLLLACACIVRTPGYALELAGWQASHGEQAFTMELINARFVFFSFGFVGSNL